ncbi:hypothetical protein Patl1_07801 [Pistacia atlantica]|uniref:Uncharacterized protein n=1 Tax=Pistacia atlantica TaxID=434234 RepID=A0ACC1AI49_9ROSI|nr:hypothetical protein Patl1_07801 [Pistacia atlantica]
MFVLLYPTNVDHTNDILNKHFQLDKRQDLFEAVENAITKLGLEKVWDVKPLVNGKEIMSVLQLKSGEPLVRDWVINSLLCSNKNCLHGSLPIPLGLWRTALTG